MSPEEIHNQIREDARKEIELEDHTHKKVHTRLSYFSKIIMGLLLVLLLILMILPYYSIKLNPEPKNIPSISEVTPSNIQEFVTNSTIFADKKNIFKNFQPSNPLIKQIASKVVSQSCPSGNKICQAKAIYYFVRDNINYVSDPQSEYIEDPLEVIYTTGADCDGMAVLLASLEGAIGINAGFVFIPNHVYVQIYLPDASWKYKDSDGWINLDATCKNCAFGEIPVSSQKSDKDYFKNI
ncbi:transglutaminase domain-containing protein [Candidatus Woesearchaeota archaeon]|jgi:hypothetical protein|nr:transglutaminase domain-containing protein [Candidatus Woesearchaeota archaeon]